VKSAGWSDVAARDHGLDTSARVISADVISGDVKSMCRIMSCAAAGAADTRLNIPNAAVQIDARIIV